MVTLNILLRDKDIGTKAQELSIKN